jgi:drug/metabolite transporter (DMT)-like permease
VTNNSAALSGQRGPDSHTLLANLCLAAAGTLWGTGFLFAKIAFAEMTVFENVLFRFLFASIVLAPVLFRRVGKFARKDFWLLLLASVVGVPVQFLVQFKGLELTTVSHASLMVGTLPMLVALSSVLFLKEHLRWLEWTALVFSAFGVVLIAVSKGSAQGPQASAKGDVLVLVSMLAAVVMILITKRLMHEYDSLCVTASMLIMGTLILVVCFVATQPVRLHFSRRAWLAVAAQGTLATAIAYICWNWGLARVPASRAGVFLNLEPLVGPLLGVWILHEALGSLTILGGGMIIAAAVYFSTRNSTSSA